MKELTATSFNFSFVVGDDDKAHAMIEVIVVVSEPAYCVDETGYLMKPRKTESLRFSTNIAGLRRVAASLTAYAEEAENTEKEITITPKVPPPTMPK